MFRWGWRGITAWGSSINRLLLLSLHNEKIYSNSKLFKTKRTCKHVGAGCGKELSESVCIPHGEVVLLRTPDPTPQSWWAAQQVFLLSSLKQKTQIGYFLNKIEFSCICNFLCCLFLPPSAIRISRKGWHMLLNFCFHTALTFAVFAGGINRIKYPIICQAVSAFSFLPPSLSKLFGKKRGLWMCIQVSTTRSVCAAHEPKAILVLCFHASAVCGLGIPLVRLWHNDSNNSCFCPT